MQTLSEIREILDAAGLKPQKRLGQNFLIDKNLMGKLLDLAELTGSQTVLEVGAGTGSLTEELLKRASRVVAVEIDRGLHEQLIRRLGEQRNLVAIRGDVLARKHAISPEVIAALGPRAVMVANLPYSIATPLVAQCLVDSWHAAIGGKEGSVCGFDSLTFTVQKEVAGRMMASPGNKAYGSISVLVALLGQITPGPVVPASAFWPRPQVSSRMIRIDFDVEAAQRVASVDVLTDVLSLAFGHRRKQIGSVTHRREAKFSAEQFARALQAAGIDPHLRAEQVRPRAFAALAEGLAPAE